MDAQTDFQLSQVSEFNNPVDKAILIRDSADPAEALNSTGIAQTEVVGVSGGHEQGLHG